MSSVGQMSLDWLIVVVDGQVGTSGHHINITEILAVSDVAEEEEVWVSTLVQDPEPAAAGEY